MGTLGWDSGFIHHVASTDELGWRLELGLCLMGDGGLELSREGAPRGSLRAASITLTPARSPGLGNRVGLTNQFDCPDPL